MSEERPACFCVYLAGKRKSDMFVVFTLLGPRLDRPDRLFSPCNISGRLNKKWCENCFHSHFFVCELFLLLFHFKSSCFPSYEWRHHVGKSGQVLCGSMLPNFIWCTWILAYNGKASQGKILWMFKQSKLLILRERRKSVEFIYFDGAFWKICLNNFVCFLST